MLCCCVLCVVCCVTVSVSVANCLWFRCIHVTQKVCCVSSGWSAGVVTPVERPNTTFYRKVTIWERKTQLWMWLQRILGIDIQLLKINKYTSQLVKHRGIDWKQPHCDPPKETEWTSNGNIEIAPAPFFLQFQLYTTCCPKHQKSETWSPMQISFWVVIWTSIIINSHITVPRNHNI